MNYRFNNEFVENRSEAGRGREKILIMIFDLCPFVEVTCLTTSRLMRGNVEKQQ